MTDEIGFLKGIASLLGLILGWLGIQTRQNTKDIKDLPKEYVLKVDYYQQNQQVLTELKGIRADQKSGQERIHDRIDDVHTRINEKEGK